MNDWPLFNERLGYSYDSSDTIGNCGIECNNQNPVFPYIARIPFACAPVLDDRVRAMKMNRQMKKQSYFESFLFETTNLLDGF